MILLEVMADLCRVERIRSRCINQISWIPSASLAAGGLPSEMWSPLKSAFEPLEDAQMGQKKHRPEEIVAKLRQVDVLLFPGRSVAEAIRTIGVTPFT